MIIATDLDRTLLYNGKEEYDHSMELFYKIVKRKKFTLAYVTGRNLEKVKNAQKEFGIKIPDVLLSDVGSRIYRKQGSVLVEDTSWLKYVKKNTQNWNIKQFKVALSGIDSLRIQEDENNHAFKLSYYLDDLYHKTRKVNEITLKVQSICPDASVVFSIDDANNIGLVDILPRCATKMTALEYIRAQHKLDKQEIIYCGDSGNDLLPLTAGYRSIVVRNARQEIKDTVKQMNMQQNTLNSLYIAKGAVPPFNGYYVSGIIEGLVKFELVRIDELNQ